MLKSLPSITRLCRVVASLTMTQKRAFKRDALFWGQHKEKETESGEDAAATRHVALFDVVNKYINSPRGKKENAADNFVHYLADQGWLKGTRQENKEAQARTGKYTRAELSTLADYLFSRIMATIRSNTDVAQGFNKLNAYMQDINYLYNKNLFEDCLYVIDDANKLAIKLDRPAYIYELGLQEQKVLSRTPSIINKSEREEKAAIRVRQAVKQLSLAPEFRELDDAVRKVLYNSKETIKLETLSKIESLWKTYQSEEITENKTELYHDSKLEDWLSPRNHHLYLALMAIYHAYKNQVSTSSATALESLESRRQYLKKSFYLFKTFKPIKEEEKQSYFNVIDGYLGICIELRKFEEIQPELKLLEGIDEPILEYRTKSYIELLLFARQYKFKEAAAFIEKKELGRYWVEHKKHFWETRLVFAFHLATCIFFMDGQYGKALDWSNLMTQEVSGATLPQIRMATKLIAVICEEERSQLGKVRVRLKKIEKEYLNIGLLPNFIELIEIHFGFAEIPLVVQEQKFKTVLNELKQNPSFDYYIYLFAWLYADFSGKSRIEALKMLEH